MSLANSFNKKFELENKHSVLCLSLQIRKVDEECLRREIFGSYIIDIINSSWNVFLHSRVETIIFFTRGLFSYFFLLK